MERVVPNAFLFSDHNYLGAAAIPRIDSRLNLPQIFPMTAAAMLGLKQQISRLTRSERRELNAYMIRLRHETPEWRRMISQRMRDMDAGKKVSLTELERRLTRG